MTSLLLQPLGPFLLAIVAGLMAGFVGTASRSLLAYAATVVIAALVVAALDLVANLRTEWHGPPVDAERGAPLVGVAWDLLTANVVVIGLVGSLVYGTLLVLSGLH